MSPTSSRSCSWQFVPQIAFPARNDKATDQRLKTAEAPLLYIVPSPFLSTDFAAPRVLASNLKTAEGRISCPRLQVVSPTLARSSAPLQSSSQHTTGGFVMVVISTINGKGGVGKTTTIVGVSLSAAALGFRVLAIDLDNQGNLTQSFHSSDGYEEEPTLDSCDVLLGKSSKLADHVKNVRRNIDLLPASHSLSSLDQVLNSPFLLREAFDRWELPYDVILIDTPGAVSSPRVFMALCASTAYYIPTDLKRYSLDALPPTVALCHQAAGNYYNPKILQLGFVASMVDQVAQSGEHAGLPVRPDQRSIYRLLLEQFGSHQSLGIIGRRDPLARAFAKGVLIDTLQTRTENTRGAIEEFGDFAARVFERAGLTPVIDTQKGQSS